jgi:hypothetical protein
VIRRAYDLQGFGKQQLAVEVFRSVPVITQPDGGFAAPDQAADLSAGGGAQRKIDAGKFGGEAFHDRREAATRQRADHCECDRS